MVCLHIRRFFLFFIFSTSQAWVSWVYHLVDNNEEEDEEKKLDPHPSPFDRLLKHNLFALRIFFRSGMTGIYIFLRKKKLSIEFRRYIYNITTTSCEMIWVFLLFFFSVSKRRSAIIRNFLRVDEWSSWLPNLIFNFIISIIYFL